MKTAMYRFAFGLLLALPALVPAPVVAQEPENADPALGFEERPVEESQETPPTGFDPSFVAEEEATLRVWNRHIVDLRARVGGLDPDERAAQAASRITSLSDSLLSEEVWSEEAVIQGMDFLLIGVQDQVLLPLRREDLAPGSRQSLAELGSEVAARIQDVLRARAEQRRWPLLLRGIGFSLAASVLFGLVLVAVIRLRGRAIRSLQRRLARRKLAVSGFDLKPYLRNLQRGLVVLASWTVVLPLAYLWLTFVLIQFPFTRPWGEGLGVQLTELLTEMTLGALGAVPGLFTVFLIFLITRFLARIVAAFFQSVENEVLHVHWLQPETAKATRRLVIVVMWIFALTVAYPYIPGSSSAAFKGVSVFVGLMVSLGATGLVNQIVSGMVIVYTRAFRPGEYVRIGDTEGVVDEIGVLSTKITTRRREHVTIPNAVLIGTSVNNYSRQASDRGAVVSTAVTIGYDVPWRQVHALLELAASRCPGVLEDPPPLVLQQGLSDFYVEYVLIVHIDDPADRYRVISELNGQTQDAFNEYGVQILSPHYRDRAEEPVVVPKEKWAPPPATSDGG